MISLLSVSKGHDSVKKVGGGTVIFLCTSYCALNLHQVKISQRISELSSGQDLPTKIFKGA